MTRALFGFIKGLLVGAGVGIALLVLTPQEDGFLASFLSYLGCALVGALVGVICGRAPWKTETAWIPVLKVSFGCILGVGLYALGHALLPTLSLGTVSALSTQPIVLNSAVLLAPIIGVLYGLFVEVDDGGTKSAPAPTN